MDVLVVLRRIQPLTIPHSPDGGAESGKCCPSLDTPALRDPLQMEQRSLVVCHSLEQTKTVFEKAVTEFGGAFHPCPVLPLSITSLCKFVP